MDGNDSKPQVFVFKKGKSSLKKSPKTIHPEGIHKKRNYKRFAKVLAIILVVAGIYGYFAYNKWLAAPDNQCNGRESSQIYKDASKVLNPAARQKLTAVVGRIKEMKRYDKDPSCLAVLTTYYLNGEDLTSAKLYMDKLNKTSGDTFVSSLGDLMDDKPTLQRKVNFLEKRVNELKTNVSGYKPQ